MVFAELVMIGAGIVIAYKLATFANRPPLGWVLLTLSFVTAFLRAGVFLYVYISPSGTGPWTFIGQALGMPITIFILAGIYVLYAEFKRKMGLRQAAIVSPQEPGA